MEMRPQTASQPRHQSAAVLNTRVQSTLPQQQQQQQQYRVGIQQSSSHVTRPSPQQQQQQQQYRPQQQSHPPRQQFQPFGQQQQQYRSPRQQQQYQSPRQQYQSPNREIQPPSIHQYRPPQQMAPQQQQQQQQQQYQPLNPRYQPPPGPPQSFQQPIPPPSQQQQQKEVEMMKVALQEMGQVVKYLEAELLKSRQASDSEIQDLTKTLKEAQSRNVDLEQRMTNMEEGETTVLKQTVKDLMEKCRLQAKQIDASESIIKQREEELKAYDNSKDGDYDGVRIMEEKLTASQNQISILQETLKTKETAVKAEFEAIEKSKTEVEERMNFYEDRYRVLEENMRTKDYIIGNLNEKLLSIGKESKEDKVRLSQMEQIVKSLEEKILFGDERMKTLEQERKKLVLERVLADKNAQENIKKMETRIKSTDQAMAALEEKKAEDELHFKNILSNRSNVENELEEKRKRLNDLELDCSEALTKYNEVQIKKAETDKKYMELHRECGELKKSCEDLLDKFENAISIKTRYEYQINFLQEKCRRLSHQPGSIFPPSANLEIVPEDDAEAPDVNEQFLNLLDMDAAEKFKELVEKCKELEKQKTETDEKLKKEMDKNYDLQNNNEELKLELNIEKFDKKNAELQQEIEKVTNNDVVVSNIDSGPIIEEVEIHNNLKNDTDSDYEDKIKQLEKELLDKETNYQMELEVLRMENLSISQQLDVFKKTKTNKKVQKIEGSDNERKDNFVDEKHNSTLDSDPSPGKELQEFIDTVEELNKSIDMEKESKDSLEKETIQSKDEIKDVTILGPNDKTEPKIIIEKKEQENVKSSRVQKIVTLEEEPDVTLANHENLLDQDEVKGRLRPRSTRKRTNVLEDSYQDPKVPKKLRFDKSERKYSEKDEDWKFDDKDEHGTLGDDEETDSFNDDPDYSNEEVVNVPTDESPSPQKVVANKSKKGKRVQAVKIDSLPRLRPRRQTR